MSKGTIARVIAMINSGKAAERVFFRHIHPNVARGFAWPILPNGEPTTKGHEFFFVFDEAHKCIGAVLYTEEDLHAYTVPKERRKQRMVRAMKDAVLPMLAAERLESQRVSVSTVEGAGFLRSLGIEGAEVHGVKFIDLSPYVGMPIESFAPRSLSSDEERRVRKTLMKASQLAEMVQNELSVILGTDDNLVGSLDSLRRDIELVRGQIADLNFR